MDFPSSLFTVIFNRNQNEHGCRKQKSISQFAYRGTVGMYSNRIYTIILIRYNENQVPIT